MQPQDYAGNSKTGKEKAGETRPEKIVEKVVVSEVTIKKKGLGRKIRDLFIEADLKSVVRYVTSDVLLPAARNMIVDSATKGIERMMYGESSMRRRTHGIGYGPRFTYNNPINRPNSPARNAPPAYPGPRTRRQDEFILSSRDEAATVLERLNDIIDQYEMATVADLNELVGFPTEHVDNKWGWVFLADVQIRQVREGWLIDLPPAEPINQ